MTLDTPAIAQEGYRRLPRHGLSRDHQQSQPVKTSLWSTGIRPVLQQRYLPLLIAFLVDSLADYPVAILRAGSQAFQVVRLRQNSIDVVLVFSGR